MKKLFLVTVAIILVVTSVTTTLIVAQDETLPQQSIRLENALYQQLRQALSDGLVTRELVDTVIDLWQGKSEVEQLKLYERIVNLIQSKQKQSRLENAFFSALKEAIELGYVKREKYDYIANIWEQKTRAEQQQLYQRVLNLLDSKDKEQPKE